MRDGKSVPDSVGIIHCVGSRDINYNNYCSAICCMQSLKFAHLVHERTGATVYNFYIDMRTPAKDYDEFYQKVFAQGGVSFGRGLWQRADAGLIDGFLVNGSARAVNWVATRVRRWQTGYLYDYAFAMIIGLIAILAAWVVLY